MTLDLLHTGLLQGCILAIIAFGMMIPFRLLNFPDLSAEGAYPLGGALCASLLVAGVPQIFAILGGVLAGGVMAFFTSQIALKLKVNSLLSGIILTTMVYSINLRVMGKPNMALFETGIMNLDLISVMILLVACTLPLALFLHTDYGLRFRAIGCNLKYAKNHGIPIQGYTALGLFMGGCMFGLAGSLMVQIQEYMDIGMGVGIVIHGLASLMIGESIVGHHTLSRQLLAPVVGALLYQQIQGVVLFIGLAPSDLKFFTGCIVLMVLALKKRDQALS